MAKNFTRFQLAPERDDETTKPQEILHSSGSISAGSSLLARAFQSEGKALRTCRSALYPRPGANLLYEWARLVGGSLSF